MTDMPMDAMVPEQPLEAPQEPLQTPMAPVATEAPNSPENDLPEVEARDELGLRLIRAAESAAEASMAARGDNDADSVEKYAQAAHKLVQAVVLLTPLTAADDVTGNAQGTGLATNRERVDQ